MPPHPLATADRNRMSKISTPNPDGYTALSKLFFLALVVVTGLRLAVIKYISRKRKASISNGIISVTEKAPVLHQEPPRRVLRPRTVLRNRDQQTSVYEPTYPWTSPPQSLPGPYDPRLYPLPTLRRHSYDPSVKEFKENSTISYTRRVSLNSISHEQSTLSGTMTISSQGWRRNQWIISGE